MLFVDRKSRARNPCFDSGKVVAVVNGFPVLSQSFVSLQLAGLIESGVSLSVVNLGKRGVPHHLPLNKRDLLLSVPLYQTHSNNGKQYRKSKHRVLAFGLYFMVTSPSFFVNVLRNEYFVNGYKAYAKCITHAFVMRKLKSAKLIHCQFATVVEPIRKLIDLGFFDDVRVVCSVRGFDISSEKYIGNVDDSFLSGVDVFLPVSASLKNMLAQHGVVENVQVVPSPVNLELIDSMCKPNINSDSGQRVRIVSVGRLVEKKGFDDALIAMRYLKENGVSFEYEIVGDGPLMDSLKAYVDKYDLAGFVCFHGAKPHDEVIDRLLAADIFVAPSKTASTGDMEGIPNSIKEAMAAGLLVVSTDHSGIPELIEDQREGLLVAEARPDLLGEKLIRAIEVRADWPVITRNARKKVEAIYGLKSTTETLIQAYSHVLNVADD